MSFEALECTAGRFNRKGGALIAQRADKAVATIVLIAPGADDLQRFVSVDGECSISVPERPLDVRRSAGASLVITET